ncbi:UDP-N-acetylmuramate--L-alanine ligase [uncultured Rikenella sp.]|uniref:UDP-N-acetylmuramate--L-alanine ligase n=1 Tax=uncultured Rikenella sp. TaxID=368003 RepID=UPI00261793A0|nr:UDP-N-acetylmuramate--L-alanine ligase [uncultured Rikenella sp.]
MNGTKNSIYFVGIGGIGMSALARYFNHLGWRVAGYDRTPSPLTAALEAEGIAVHYEDSVDRIPADFRNRSETRVIYTPAVPADHAELCWFRTQGFEVLKRSQMLGLLGEGRRVMAVAGTHGKTTTTTMVAHFNAVAAGEGSAFLGGISKNFDSNLVLGAGLRMAVEADEFDRSFLQLHPQAAVITSVDPDHLDIYGTYEAVREAFAQFAGQITPGGTLILKKGIELPLEQADIRRYTYHVTDSEADFHAENLRVDGGGYYTFDLVFPDRRIERCRLGIPGLVNVENCVAAAALVWSEGFVLDERMREAIATFRGVQRRFDFWVNDPSVAGGTIYMDDYAHHPAELRAMLSSVRKMFPERELTVIFQPHLYTRTRDFAPEFAEALSLADRVWLLPIYPARELPIPGVASEMILDGITTPRKRLISKEQLLEEVAALATGGVLVTAGAGDIDRFCAPVAALVQRKNGGVG